MPTNSAEPQQLAGYADLVRPRAEDVRATIPRLAWALASYRSSCSELPIDESVCAIADAAVDALREVLGDTERIGAAFALADARPGPGPTTVRWLDDGALTPVLEEVVDLVGGVELDAGPIAEHETSWSLTEDGLEAGVTASLLLGVRATKEATVDLGPVSSTTRITGTAGALAEGSASASIGKDGVRAGAEGELFAGVKVEAENETSFGPCRIAATATGSAGVGVAGSAEAELSRERVAAKVEVLTTLGLGAGADVAASCDIPSAEDVLRWAGDAGARIDDGTVWIGARAEDAAGWVDDRAQDAVGWVDDRVDDLRSLPWSR